MTIEVKYIKQEDYIFVLVHRDLDEDTIDWSNFNE